ncbi:MAG: 23S rRNA (pseudouridine(1915)-N(3))-methyltransferase RlmH [Myxococcales bacterium]|nr:23S rRNA (pseudouridine(1915)-N(3))-methyltransferase RlmH [Myxococcales bacterium]
MKLCIVAVGELKSPGLRGLVDDYYGRIRRHVALEELECKPPRLVPTLERAVRDATLVALDVGGVEQSSPALARRLEGLGRRGKGVVVFAIGGADGLPRDVLAQAHERWSLSRLTLPHRLARLFLAEQLYRAFTILRGEPYSH